MDKLSTPPSTPRVAQPPAQTRAATSRQHGGIAPASAQTRNEKALTDSIVAVVATHQETCRVLEDMLHKPVGPLKVDVKTCQITFNLFNGTGASMRPVWSMERGIERLCFELPAREIHKEELFLVVELLNTVAAPNAIAELLAAAAMGPWQTVGARLELLATCHATVEKHELMLCSSTLDQLAGSLQVAWKDGQDAIVEQIANILGKSLVKPEAAKTLSDFLVKAFDQAMQNGRRELAAKAIALLGEWPWPQARKAIRQPLLVMASANARDAHAKNAPRSMILASAVRDGEPGTQAQLHQFKEDLKARLSASLQAKRTELVASDRIAEASALQLWTENHLEGRPGPHRALTTPGELHSLLSPFLHECRAACAYASVALNPEVLLPIFQLIRHFSIGFSIETVTLCMDFLENPMAMDTDRAEIYPLLKDQLFFFTSAPDRMIIAEFHFSVTKLFFHRLAKTAFLLNAVNSGQSEIDYLFQGLQPRIASSVYREILFVHGEGFRSKRSLKDIADHIIHVVIENRLDRLDSVPFYHEVLGEYLRRFLEAGMREKAESMLAGLMRRLQRGFANLILGASDGGKLQELHGLLDLCATSSISKTDLKLVAWFVSDVLLEVAQSSELASLHATLELIQQQWPQRQLEIMAVCYVQASARNQLVLAKLVRLEMSRFSWDIAHGRNTETAMRMARESLNFELHHASPRRPSLQADCPDKEKVARLMGSLEEMLVLETDE